MILKRKGFFAGLSVLAAAILYTMIASSFFMIANGMFSAHRASRTATQAQQYADIDADTLKLLSYDMLDEKGAHPRQNIEIEGANGWQDEVTITDEKLVDKDKDAKQRIATIKIYKEGDFLSRFSLQVPLSSQGSTVGVPIGTVIAWPVSSDPDGIWSGYWLECNGQAVDASQYPKLAKLMNAVPDYRGVFLRGLGSQSGDGVLHSSNGLGLIQGDSSRQMDGNVGAYLALGTFNGSSDGGYQHPIGSSLSGKQPYWISFLGEQGYVNINNNWVERYPNSRFNLSGDSQNGYSLSETVEYPATVFNARSLNLCFDVSRVWPVSNEFRPVNKSVRYMIKAK